MATTKRKLAGAQIPLIIIILIAFITAAVFVLGILGTIAFSRTDKTAQVSGFRRDPIPNCNEVFFCMYASDPNPSYVQFQVPPLTEGINNYQFLEGDIFDISSTNSTILTKTGVYLFSGFFAMFSQVPAEVAIIMTANNETLLTSPAVDGTVTSTDPLVILGNMSFASARFAFIARMDAGTELRVGFVVTQDVMVTPGAYWAGAQIS